jgi:hypothetical protein
MVVVDCFAGLTSLRTATEFNFYYKKKSRRFFLFSFCIFFC